MKISEPQLSELLKCKADSLLNMREDLYEMHFHQSDREWLINAMIDFAAMNHMYFGEKITENTSDGYHTFIELYDLRKVYNAALFNRWGIHPTEYDVHKSWRHNDGELCFGGGWFIVSAMLPNGQISNHYKSEDWELFKIPIEEKAKFVYDGHTSQDVISRLSKL